VPVDDRQARPAPAREPRFHADGGPRRFLRDPDEPIASMLELSIRPDEPGPGPTSRRTKPVVGVLSPDVRFRDAARPAETAGTGTKSPDP
jgi:hypothetical protein